MTDGQRKLRAAMGELPGASDLMFVAPSHPGLLHCVECKVRRNLARRIKKTTSQTKAQIDFAHDIRFVGGRYAVVRDFDDMRAALLAWGIPTREVAAA